MSDSEIIAYYDSHLNATISDIVRLSGKSREYIKALLLG